MACVATLMLISPWTHVPHAGMSSTAVPKWPPTKILEPSGDRLSDSGLPGVPIFHCDVPLVPVSRLNAWT